MNAPARIALVAAAVVGIGAALYFSVGPGVIGRTVDNSTEPLPFATTDDRLLNPDVRPAKAGPYPKIEVEEPKHDFGVVALGRSDSHTFVVKNVGEAPLLLGKPITTCKCTAPEAGTGEPIAPGESTTVTLTYTPEKEANEFAQRAYIHTNDPTDPRLELEVHGRVEPLLKAFPGESVDFGAVDGKEPVVKKFRVLSTILEELTVTDATASSDYLEVTTAPADLSRPLYPSDGEADEDETDEEEAGEAGDGEEGEEEEADAEPVPSAADAGFVGGVEVTVKLLPGMAVGRIKEQVTLQFDLEAPDMNRPKEGKIMVDYRKMTAEVVGTVRGPFAFVAVQRPDQKFLPSVLAFELGTFPSEEGTKGTLQMFVDGMEEPLELTDVESTEEYVQLKVRRDPSFPVESGRQKLFLDFVVPPGSPPATHIRKGKVTVTAKTNHPDARELQFYIQMASYR